MFARIKTFLAPPTFASDDQNRIARILNVILLATTILLLIFLFGRLLIGTYTLQDANFYVLLGLACVLIGLKALLQRGHLYITAIATVASAWLAILYVTWNARGVDDTGYAAFILAILTASLVLGWRAVFVVVALTIGAGWSLAYLETTRSLPNQIVNTPYEIMTDMTVIYVMSAVFLYLLISNLSNALAQARQTNNALRKLSEQLEQRVEARTQELERAVAALQASEERFTLAVEGSNDGIWDWNIQTGAVYFAPRWKAILGHDNHEISSDFAELNSRLHPDDHDRVVQALQDYLEGQIDAYNIEFRVRHKDGSYRWVRNRGGVRRAPDGAPIRMAGSLTDITTRKEFETRLIQEQQRVQAILESITVPLLISRLTDGFVLYGNDALTALIGLPNVDPVGKATPDFYNDPVTRDLLVAALQTQGYVHDQEVQLRRSNGEPFWALVSAHIIDFEDQPAVITTLIDITTRQQAQITLAKRAVELATVAQVGTAASTTLDPDILLQQVVDLTKASFDLYHAHIYLLEREQEKLVLTAASGAIGRQMVALGHQIPLAQEQSVVARAARSRQGITVNDVQTDPGFLPNSLLPNTRAEMAVPVMIGGLLLGVLDVQAEEPGRFTQEDITIYTTLASQIAVALQNARQYEHTQTALAETEILLNIAQITSSSLELEGILTEVLDSILTATQFEAGLISLVNPQTETLEILSHRLPERFLEMLQQQGLPGTLCDLVYQRREPVIVLDMTKDAPINVTSVINLGYQSYQGVPIQVRGEILGTICIFSNTPLNEQKTNIDLLQGIGQQVGSAIENAALFEQTQKLLAETETFRRLVENATQGIGLATQSGEFTYVNPILARMLEAESPENVIGKGLVTYHTAVAQEKFQTEIQAAMEATGFWQGELEMILPSGQIIPAQESYFLLFDETDAISNLAVIITDISERKTAEAAQQAAQRAQEELTAQLGERLQQLNVLQRAMTREGWQAFLTAEDRVVQGYQYNQDAIRMIARHEMQTGDEDDSLPLSTAQAIQLAQAKDAATTAAPLQVHGETIGFLGVRDPSGKPIDSQTQAMLQQISAQVTEALERARLFEETEQARSQTDDLFKGSERVIRAANTDDILQALVQATALRHYDSASVFIFDRPWQDEIPETITLTAVWRRDGRPSSIPLGMTLPLATYPVLHFLRRHEIAVIENIDESPRLDDNARAIIVQGMGMRGLLTVPLIASNQWFGFVLALAKETRAINEADQRQLASLAGQASIVAQTQRLYQVAESRARHEQLLREVGARVSAAVDAESVLRTAAREIGRALGLQTYVYLKPSQQKPAAVQDGNGAAIDEVI